MRRQTLRRLPLIGVLIVFALAGVYFFVQSHAASPYVAVEAEDGVKSGPVTAGDTADASNGASVRFGSVSSILFEDDFNGAARASFDPTKWDEWSGCTYNSSAYYGNIKCGKRETLDGQGHLIIPATPDTGSSIYTGDRFKFTYGTLSAWIKFPSQVGYWPAFWTLNSNANGTDNPNTGELDVMEGYTTWNDGYHAGFHNWLHNGVNEGTGGGPDLCQQNIDLSAAYHKYSAKIEPNKLTFFFDDKQCGTTYGPQNNPNNGYGFGPSATAPNWLILTLAIGGAAGQQKPATQNAQMLVDRVEVRSN